MIGDPEKIKATQAMQEAELRQAIGDELYDALARIELKKFKDIINETMNMSTEYGFMVKSIERVLEGQEPSDLALSFPIVRKVWEVVNENRNQKL